MIKPCKECLCGRALPYKLPYLRFLIAPTFTAARFGSRWLCNVITRISRDYLSKWHEPVDVFNGDEIFVNVGIMLMCIIYVHVLLLSSSELRSIVVFEIQL